MNIPFTKAHGARNDFLLTWRDQLPPVIREVIGDVSGDVSGDVTGHVKIAAAAARAICDRHTGAGADGWILLSRAAGEADGSIELWNSDGSRSEISGNRTRCAAALLMANAPA